MAAPASTAGSGDVGSHILKAIAQRINGIIYENDGHLTLQLDETAVPVYLRFALVRQGSGEQILPVLLLDDWGTEIRGLPLYQWVYENGDAFPRAELFGFDPAGREVQYFLREIEIYIRYPCYVYPESETPLVDGRLLTAIAQPDPSVAEPEKIKPLPEVKRPLRQANVTWWRTPPSYRPPV